ncbi:hypothetical protein G6F44_000217 [Rhizopus delemar]|nr:hypothetical protein G6F44_000217 [Rhizopus delemar]
MSTTELTGSSMRIRQDLSLDSNHIMRLTIEKLNADLCQAIYTSLDDSCGRVSLSTGPLRDFWTDKLQEAYAYRELCYRKWRKAYGLNKLHYWLKHQEARATLRRLIAQRRRETWTTFCKQMASEEYTKAISKLSRIRKNRTLKPIFSTPEGPQHAADIMASYLEATFSSDLLKNVQLYEIDTPILPFEIDCLFTRDDINITIRSLPIKKAPGIDHLRNKMLQLISHLLAPILFHLFHMCWAWSYVPQIWCIAQVIPIYKKGSPSYLGNYRPISLITIFRKILERCIQHILQTDGPPLDIAQGGFRESRSALDQALSLTEISHVLRTHYHVKPALAFLGIKSAYDTVNRSFVWDTLSRYISSPMLSLLRCLFDDVQTEILLSNTISRRFNPKTGALQDSILSPYLYSVYINQLPAQLRPQAITTDMSPLETIPLLNCLLYADDVVIINERTTMTDLLRKCEEYSLQMGYRWNPSKCVILDNQLEPIPYTIYNQALPQATSFAYLGVPFKPGGYLDLDELIRRKSSKALATMNVLKSIGINPSGFYRLLSTRFYAHIVRPQLEYGLAINRFTITQLKSIEDVQDTCIRKIHGTRGKTCTKLMLHIAKLPLMADQVHISQAQFLYRSLHLSDDALLCRLLPHIRHIRGHQWFLLSKTPLGKSMYTVEDRLVTWWKAASMSQTPYVQVHTQTRHYLPQYAPTPLYA